MFTFNLMLARFMVLAYIDPSTGGMLFQILAMVFAVFSGLVFFFFRQIKSGLARFKRFITEKFGS